MGSVLSSRDSMSNMSAPPSEPVLRITEDVKHGVCVEGLSNWPIASVDDTMELIGAVIENRVVRIHKILI